MRECVTAAAGEVPADRARTSHARNGPGVTRAFCPRNHRNPDPLRSLLPPQLRHGSCRPSQMQSDGRGRRIRHLDVGTFGCLFLVSGRDQQTHVALATLRENGVESS
jgi:hypothetical protein